jgi:hypothetical protein
LDKSFGAKPFIPGILYLDSTVTEKKEIKAILMNLFKMVKDFLTGNSGSGNGKSACGFKT